MEKKENERKRHRKGVIGTEKKEEENKKQHNTIQIKHVNRSSAK